METQSSRSLGSRVEPWIALALCAAVLVSALAVYFIFSRPSDSDFTRFWFPVAAAMVTAVGVMRLNGRSLWLRLQPMLLWIGLLLMVWSANGLPFDFLRLVGLIPLDVDWPGLVIRILAFTDAIVIAHLALASPASSASSRTPVWYAYAAFLLALTYPVLRTCWAFGGTLGLMWPGAGGEGFTPWLACTPWLLAAVLSLLLASNWRWLPRRLLLVAGWTATAIVAMIGPAAVWSLITGAVDGNLVLDGIAVWVPCLFYSSWFLFAIAAAAATRSYQLRSAALRISSPA